MESKNTAAAKTTTSNKRKSVTTGKETDTKAPKIDFKGLQKSIKSRSTGFKLYLMICRKNYFRLKEVGGD